MAIHYVVLSDLANSPGATAIVDVSADGMGDVEYTVFPAGSHAQVALDANGYASSANSTLPNLLTEAGGHLALVHATTTAGPSGAVLSRRSGSSKVILALPVRERSLGRAFVVPIGSLGAGTYLLVGNPNGVDANLTLRFGGSSSIPAVSPQVLAGNAIKIQVTNAETNVLLESDQDVIVQLCVDTGTIDEAFVETFVLPL